MQTNQVLSDKLKVVPDLKADETATFMLINAQKKEVGRDEPSSPLYVKLAGQQNVTDPYDTVNTRKTIANVIGAKPAMDGGKPKHDDSGKQIMIPAIEGVLFERGFLTLTADQNQTFHYMMRRTDNLSNPFRNIMGGKGKSPRFKLVEDKKELEDILHLKEIHYVAQKMVREASMETLKTIAIKMNESPDSRLHVKSVQGGDPQSLKLEMIQKADNFPKLVIQYSNDQIARCKVQIFECMKFGIIRYDNGAFYLLGKEYKEIHKPGADEDPVESLLKFFTGNEKTGREKYQDMAETLKKTLKA